MSSQNSLLKLNYPSGRRPFLRAAIAGVPLAAELLRSNSTFGNSPLVSTQHAATDRSGHLNYHPEGLYVWDVWFFTRGDEVHMIHLQKKRPGSRRPDEDDGALGHAVTTDLLTWTELPIALYRGPAGSIDDLDLFTGCTYEHEGKYYTFYTARAGREKGIYQRICLATSDDTIHWTKHPEPVIVPDRRWYTKEDCRDLIIQRHPQTGEFHGFYAAGIARKELVERNVIAHVRSRDLIRWTHEPPAFLPEGHAVVECPDVFYLKGRWWMTCNAGHQYGARAHFTDPYVTWGTIYASADRIEGPYREAGDNVLIGSMEFNGFCCRSAVWKGKRYLFYGQGERIDRRDRGEGTTGTITTPKILNVSPQGKLRPIYSPLIEERTGNALIQNPTSAQLDEVGGRFGTSGEWWVKDDQIKAISRKSWSARFCGPEADNLILSADLRLDQGRAIGLMFRQFLTVFLDYQEQRIMFTHVFQFQPLDSRRLQLIRGSHYQMRLVAKKEFCEVYLDNALVLNFVRYQPVKGRIGLYIEAGEGSFSNIKAVSLTV